MRNADCLNKKNKSKMKYKYVLVVILLFFVGYTFSQDNKPNQISVSLGLWERDYSWSNGDIYHTIGPIAAIDYQRSLNPYISIRGKFFGGGIYNSQRNEMARHLGVSAGILVTPLGRIFSNLKIGIAPLVLIELVNDQPRSIKREQLNCWYGVEVPVKFYIIDTKNWSLAIGSDVQFGTAKNYSGGILYTAESMITYGIKF